MKYTIFKKQIAMIYFENPWLSLKIAYPGSLSCLMRYSGVSDDGVLVLRGVGSGGDVEGVSSMLIVP